MQGRTTVIIAHRMSTIKAAYIYVLENGRIVQDGNFEKLMNEAGGKFQDIAAAANEEEKKWNQNNQMTLLN